MKSILLLIVLAWLCEIQLGTVRCEAYDDLSSDGEAPHITEQPLDLTVARHQPATLNCRAGGSPPPTIRWFKDGVPVAPDAHRVVLPAGELFFLRAAHGRSHSDAGIYWCEAINLYGTARSRNASLHVAVLRDEFRLEPASAETAQGETVLLECAPPKGNPEPTVSWKKNGQNVHYDTDSRMHLVDGGSLVIQDIRQSDAGQYQCVARNAAGSRESAVAELKVHIKPYLITGPEDVIARTGGSVTFQCRVGGDPLPDILWRRTAGGGTMPFSRIKTLEDRSLRIDGVTIADEGEYFCEADNSVGSVSASGILTVYDPPTIQLKPSNQNVDDGATAIFECFAKGRPQPTMFWSIEGNRSVIFPGSSRGKIYTSPTVDGSTVLKITNLTKNDSEIIVVCSAVNFAGSAFLRGKVIVTSEDDKPPPVVTNGPGNQTLPIKSVAVFPCTVTGNPKPDITWYHNGSPVIESARKNISFSGSLMIKDLDKSDSGTYTCLASSKNGKYIWSGDLLVDLPTNPSVHFFRAPDLSNLPGAPNKLHVANHTGNTITLVWNQSNKIGSSSLIGYRVEMFSRELYETNSVRSTHTWTVIGERIKDTHYVAKKLMPGATYIFFVRAENSHGVSEPSKTTEPITIPYDTKKVGSKSSYNDTDVKANLLSDNIVELIEATPIDSTTIKVMWEVLNFYYLEGLFLYYRNIDDDAIETNEFEVKTIMHSNDVSGFEISTLKKFSRYEFFLIPFYNNFEGKPSNCRVATTMDDAPDGPPTDVEMYIVNSTTVHLKWSPPESHLQNGYITRYNVLVYWLDIPANKSMVTINTTVETATSLIMTNLTSGVSYSVQVAAATVVGYGPYSPIMYINIETKSIGLDPLNRFNSNDVSIVAGDFVMETWFILLIISIIIFKIVIITGIVYIRKANIFTKKSALPNIYDSNGTSLVTQMNIKNAVSMSHPLTNCYNKNSVTKTESLLWMENQPGLCLTNKKIDSLNEKASEDYDKTAPPLPEYAEVTSSRVTGNEWNTSKTATSPAAYASVTLVGNTRQCVSSLGWFPSNKMNDYNSQYGQEEELYPANNGGYYNRNVYSEKLRKPINFYDFNRKVPVYNKSLDGNTRIFNDDNYESDDDNYADERNSEYGNLQAMKLLNHHYARPDFEEDNDEDESKNATRSVSRFTSFKRCDLTSDINDLRVDTTPR